MTMLLRGKNSPGLLISPLALKGLSEEFSGVAMGTWALEGLLSAEEIFPGRLQRGYEVD